MGLMFAALASAIALLPVGLAATVYAVTPTPSATPTTVASPPPAPAAMLVTGNISIDSSPAAATVQAVIGEVVCATTQGFIPPGADAAAFILTVPSEEQRAGCGRSGATIRFIIDGRPANESTTWVAGAHAAIALTLSLPRTGSGFSRAPGSGPSSAGRHAAVLSTAAVLATLGVGAIEVARRRLRPN